jgi:hypothetical protein
MYIYCRSKYFVAKLIALYALHEIKLCVSLNVYHKTWENVPTERCKISKELEELWPKFSSRFVSNPGMLHLYEYTAYVLNMYVCKF